MPVKLIGPKVGFKGKTLWEILGSLKNLGVGRLVVKSHFFNYPEPSYYKIVRVQPTVAPQDKYDDRRVFAWAEHVFRGKKYPELVELHYNTNRAMFQLIPRSEEGKYTNATVKERISEVPKYREWPPLLKIILKKDLNTKDLPKLETIVVVGPDNNTVLKDTGDVLKSKPPKIHLEASVAELTEKLAALKAAAADKDTPVS